MNNEFDFENEIIEIDNNASIIENEISTSNNVKEKKDGIITKIKKLPKKTKIIILVCILLILIILICLLFLNKDDNTEEVKKENIVYEENNYRFDNGTLIFLDSKEEIGTYKCKDNDKDKCFVAFTSNNLDKFDKDIHVYENEDEVNFRSKIFNKKYVFINDDNKIMLYDIKSEELIDKYDNVKIYDNYAIVSDDEKYGLINFEEDTYEMQINMYYDYLGFIDLENKLLLSTTNNKDRIINIDNKQVSKEFTNNIMSLNKKYIAAKVGEKYNLFTYDYEELLSGFDFISFSGDYINVIKDKKLYVYNSDLIKMNEDGIKVESDDYNTKYIYDKNKKLIETIVPFTTIDNKNNISVTVDDNNKVLNVYDGLVSSTFNYVSYYDSKLYFYDDVEKTNLFDTYECKNKNKLNSTDSKMNNCFITSYSNKYTGIYNDNYVFINDNEDLKDNKDIILYSLKENKKKATYKEIVIIDDEYTSDKIDLYYPSSMFVIAKSSSKDKYGVIEITSDNVISKIAFNYNNIVRKNGNFILMSDKKSTLYDNSFTRISDDLDYLEIINNYYVGINNGLLNIYKIETGNTPIISDKLEIKGTDYASSYKVEINDTIKITIGDKLYEYDLTGKKIEKETNVDNSNNNVEDNNEI